MTGIWERVRNWADPKDSNQVHRINDALCRRLIWRNGCPRVMSDFQAQG